MALTPAEKQRQYRERLKNNSEKYKEAKNKDRERKKNTRKKINDLSVRGQRYQRKYWREKQAESRSRKNQSSLSTPIQKDQLESSCSSEVKFSENKRRGRKKVCRSRSKLARDNLKLQEDKEKLQRQVEMYKKRWLRQVKSEKGKKTVPENQLTPKSKTRVTMEKYFKGKVTRNHPVARQLFLHNVFKQTLLDKYKTANNKKKRLIQDIITNKTMKKYRLLRQGLYSFIGVSNCTIKPISEKKNLALKRKALFNFFERDDNSRATAGKRETITRKKEKRQKRYLSDTMKNLHKKFCSENPNLLVSYATFTRFRPFHVLAPSVDNRNTCACVIHANIKFKVQKLVSIKALQTNDLKLIYSPTVCNINSIDCMYNNCHQCKENDIEINETMKSNIINWFSWEKRKEIKQKVVGGKEKEITIQKICKEKKEGPVHLLIKEFKAELVRFKKHCFNINKQFIAYRMCKNNLGANEALLHIDFSENYLCKLSEEVQAFHFGGSRAQATLHTGVLYIGGESNPISFCTISPSNDHSPGAIWAHLKPIFELLKSQATKISMIHFFSDGPSSQYRQKKNFYLFSHLLFDYGFTKGTWSYFEAGHGKGAADGVGAVIKRTADALVSHGVDIFDAYQLYENVLGKTAVKVFFIEDIAINCEQRKIPSDITALTGTFNVHQIITRAKGNFFYRKVSCYCQRDGFCECFPLKEFSYGNVAIQRQNFRQNIYSSSSDSDMSIDLDNLCTTKDEKKYEDTFSEEVSVHKMCEGTHVLVEFTGGSRKKTKYTYAAVIQEKIDDEGDIKIMSLKANDSKRKIFHTDENDISYIHFDQITSILPQPKLIMRGNRIFYEFPVPLDTFEK